MPRAILAIALLIAAGLARAADALTPEQVALSISARGVLAHNCTKCHGQQKQKGGLRLDLRDAAMKGGEDGVVIKPGNADGSDLIRRIRLKHGDDDVMPPEKGPLDPQDLAVLVKWIAAGAPWPDGATAGIVFQRAPLAPRTPAFPAGSEKIANPIDRFVAAYFAEKKITSPPAVDDRTFLRRASLDAIGLAPTWAEMQAFKGDRAAAVDGLLARNADYAAHWLTFWNDALRNDYTGAGYIDGGRAQISQWLYSALEGDQAYDQFVRDLVTPAAGAEGFIKGIKWRGNVSAGQRVELQAAQNVAQVFLGLNLKCASCHDSFINDYKLTDSHALAAVFADKPLDVFRCDVATGKTSAPGFFWPELGTPDPAAPRPERQKQLAALLTKKEDGRLARVLVNRLWAACFGRGLVEPVDVMDNAPWSRDLLDWLAADFADNGWKVKRTLRLILTSGAYALPAVEVANSEDLARQDFVFRGPVVRRMSAEQFTDAVGRIAVPLVTQNAFAATEKSPQFAAGAVWIWHDEGIADLNAYPEGKRWFRLKVELPPGRRVRVARAVGTADNIFACYANGTRIFGSSAWERAVTEDFTDAVAGQHSLTLAIEAENTERGAAGLRFALGIWFEGEKAPMILSSGPGWKSSAQPKPGWEKPEFDDREWGSAIVLGPGGLPWGGLAGFTLNDQPFIVRAAFSQNDALQAALGRPIRDQVTMSRASQATLLQALTFANGRSYSAALDRAGAAWMNKVPDPKERLAAIYRAALLRDPRAEEMAFANTAPNDLLWAIFSQPEFQLIR